MFGFLLKMLVTVFLIGGIGLFITGRFSGQMPDIGSLGNVLNLAKQVDVKAVSSNLSYQLDKLITHTDRSPMVMGIDITNKSLEAMVDSIRSLPPQELELVRKFVCEDASPAAQ